MTSLYVFKNIQTIHTSDELIDIVLSKVQRKTATVVHPGYAMVRIKAFYMRKVKFCAENFKEKLDKIINDFPKLDDIHPFFADILNVLYDKDHYKIALGQINVVRNIIEKIAADYTKLMKFSDSLYRCKQLKIAAFGRMATAVKKINSSLQYLEEVRKHIGRLPNIDPFLPTVLLFGYPNVGKSSYMNKITRANVEISSMPFSTQNLFVGHTEYKNVKIQCIDSPGVLDRALEQRNTIEMQSITALAHLKSLVMFLVDVSETCGHSIKDQLMLYESLKPLFQNKPVVLALTKVDLQPVEDLDQDNQSLIQQFTQAYPQVSVVQLSSENEDLVMQVKDQICQQLMTYRMQVRAKNQQLKTDEDYFAGVQVIVPSHKTTQRQTHIPNSVIQEKQVGKQQKKTLKDYQEENGGAGIFNFPWNEHFMLENNDWKYDVVPEIMDGKNIMDFVDPEIERKILELEKEQEQMVITDEHLLNEEEQQEDDALEQVRDAKFIKKQKAKLNNNRNLSKGKFDVNSMREKLQQKGKNSEKAVQRLQKKLERKKERKFNRGMEIEESKPEKKSLRDKWTDPSQGAEKRRRKIQKKTLVRGQSGDADHRINVKKPKHLFAGKTGRGTRDRR